MGLQFYSQADRFWYNLTVWTPETYPRACTQIKYWRQELFLISSCSSISLASVKTHQILSQSSISPNFWWGFLGPNLFLKMRQISLGINGISEFRLFLWYVRNLSTCVCVRCALLECLSGSCAFGGDEAFSWDVKTPKKLREKTFKTFLWFFFFKFFIQLCLCPSDDFTFWKGIVWLFLELLLGLMT